MKKSVIGCDHACDTDIGKGSWAQRTADVQQSEHERVGREAGVFRRCGSVDDGPVDRGVSFDRHLLQDRGEVQAFLLASLSAFREGRGPLLVAGQLSLEQVFYDRLDVLLRNLLLRSSASEFFQFSLISSSSRVLLGELLPHLLRSLLAYNFRSLRSPRPGRFRQFETEPGTVLRNLLSWRREMDWFGW